MPKILGKLLQISRGFAKMWLPLLSSLITRGLSLQSTSLTMAANYSRRFGVRSILVVGALATAYASYLFMMSELTPDMPKASHDVILKSRLSSPLPSQEILIVDIDERTLASLSGTHGRWPWSRDVLADGLQKFSDLNARAVLFNVLLSDADKANPDADAAMDVTAQMVRPTAFPLIRLNPKNDAESQLQVTQIPGGQIKGKTPTDTTLAAILPMFSSMHDRLGVANHKPDADGIVRKYPLRWEEAGFNLPSIVQRTAELAGADIAKVPNLISLNWRNKQGRYNRISFSDVLLDQLKPEQTKAFNNAYVILSLSAPGLGQTKPTAVTSIEDDGEILATALDDAINSTYLRILPNSAALILNLLTIWILVWMSLKRGGGGFIDKAFVLVQSGLGGITLLSASYTNYLIDLSDSMSFGLSVFAAIKLVQSMDDRWSRARPGFRKGHSSKNQGKIVLLGYLEQQVGTHVANHLQKATESIVGLSNVVRVDDLFNGESFIKSHCSRFNCLLVHVLEGQMDLISALLSQPAYRAVTSSHYQMSTTWDPENKGFIAEVAPVILDSAAQLLHAEWVAKLT